MIEANYRNLRVVDLFLELAGMDSPSLSEGKIAAWLKQYFLNRYGVVVEEDGTAGIIGGESGNLLVRIPGNIDCSKKLFAVHIDTVDPCHDKRIIVTGDTIKTDGKTILGADDVAGLASILAALEEVKTSALPHGDLELLFTVAEEKHLLGSSHIQKDWLKSEIAYVLDTSGAPGIAVNQAPGHIDFYFKLTGHAAHAGIAPETGVSAIQAAAESVSRMRLGRPAPGVTANIGTIRGGTATNIVAENCEITAECRAQKQEDLVNQAEHMEDCVRQVCKMRGVKLEVKRHQSYYPFITPENGKAAVLFREACEKSGLDCEFQTGGGGSDLNHLVRLGIEGIVVATGMENVHSCQEQQSIKHLLQLENLVVSLMSA